MSLKTNEIIIGVLNNHLDEVKQLLADTTPGGIDALSPETIKTLEERGYGIEQQHLTPQFLLDFIFDWWSNENSNPERIALLHQTLSAYASASMNDYFNGLLLLAYQVSHQKKHHLQYNSGLAKTPQPTLNALYETLLAEITKKQHPHQCLGEFLRSQRYFYRTPEIEALFPKHEKQSYNREETIDYKGYYEALTYRESGATVLTVLIHRQLFSSYENQRFTGSHLEKLDQYANTQGEPLRLQFPLSEDELLNYLNSDTYKPDDLKINIYDFKFYSTDDNNPYRKWSSEEKETKFSARYDLLIRLGLSEEKIRTELLKPYLLGIIREDENPNSRWGTHKVKVHTVFPQWQINGLLKKLGLTINDALIDGEKPILACFKQSPADALEHLISVGGIILNDDDVKAFIHAINAEYQTLAAKAQSQPSFWELEPLQSKITVIYKTLSNFEPHKLDFLRQMHAIKILPKPIEETFEREEAALTDKITIMDRVCAELSTDRNNAEAIKQTEFEYNERLRERLKNPPIHKTDKPLKSKTDKIADSAPMQASSENPSPSSPVVSVVKNNMAASPIVPTREAPSATAPVNTPVDTFDIDFQYFVEGRARPDAKTRLFKELIRIAYDKNRRDFIINTLKENDDRLKICKNELITLALANSNKIRMQRQIERDALHQGYSYLTFILGLGQSNYTFKPTTESLKMLDVSLGIIPAPSIVTNSLERLSRWASKPKAADATTSTKDNSHKGPQ